MDKSSNDLKNHVQPTISSKDFRVFFFLNLTDFSRNTRHKINSKYVVLSKVLVWMQEKDVNADNEYIFDR